MDTGRVGVMGCGNMGHGIAQLAAQAGHEVIVREVDDEAAQAGMAMIERNLERAVKKGTLESDEADGALARIHSTTEYAELADCDFLIEAVDEDLERKLEAWEAVDPYIGESTICATNTSSLSVVDQATATSHPDRFIGMHFFNPPQLMKLVEVVRALTTAAGVFERASEFATGLGKQVVQAPDRSGFIVNRLLLPYTMDATRIYENGYGTIADIDNAMRHGAAYPMGPFTLLDYVGLDIALAITEVMYDEHREPRFAAPVTIRNMVSAGHLGRKSGRGFYSYESDVPVPADELGSATVVA